MKKTNIEQRYHLLLVLIGLSFLSRIYVSYLFGDKEFDGQGEWGILVESLIYFNTYSLYHFDNLLAPSVYMPPLYPFLLYLINIISLNKVDFINLIIFLQSIISTLSVYIFYKINLNFFSSKLSLFNSLIFSLFPLNVYMSGQISSITLQVFLSLLFLNLLFLIINQQTKKNIILFSIISGLLILTRGEFILVFIFLLVMLSKKIKFLNLMQIILIVSLVVSPYMIRNYFHFNSVILVKSLGFNLWKGNNELSLVEGYEEYNNIKFKKLKSNILNLEETKNYEINRDKLFMNEAKNYLINDPVRYVNLFFKKLLAFYFVDLQSSYPKYYSFFNFVPTLLISLLSFPGLFLFYKKKNTKNKYLLLYLTLNLIVFSIFFILPRYKLIILPIQIILIGCLIKYMLNKFNIKYL
jgi:4-amino-4-deoxy-L-arabinose transferase-like glycosyltransferase